MTASGCALSVASGEEGPAATASTPLEAEDEGGTEGSKSVGGAV